MHSESSGCNDDDFKVTTSTPRHMRYGDPQEKKGYLLKEGKTLKFRLKRYLCLKGKTLSHSKDPRGAPTWSLDVSQFSATQGTRALELVISDGSKSVSFFAGSQEELEGWLRALKAARCKLEDWYKVGNEIGHGSYGKVHVGEDIETGEKVAIKFIKKNPASKRQVKFIEREIRILKAVNHPHVIQTLDVFEDDEKLSIVTEFMEHGELFERIIEEKLFTEDKAREVTRQMLCGVEHLHSLQIVHRDIKPENVLCTKAKQPLSVHWRFQVKLTDFGLSNIINDADNTANALLSHVGTSYYLAPEVIGRKGYGPGVDVWACGIVLYVMLSGRFPFWGKSDIDFLRSLERGPDFASKEWDMVSNDGKQFVRTLLTLDPSRRPSASQALAMPWITQEPSQGDENCIKKLDSVAGIATVLSNKREHVPKSSALASS